VWNSSSGQFEACAEGTIGVFDAWEGEDKNKNGTVEKDENETLLETSAIMTDSDGDGLWDGDEVKPEMISEDDVVNPTEYTTDPLMPDTDRDGISDYREITGWNMTTYWEVTYEVRKDTYMVYSDPTDSDTDDDGLLDGDEYVYTGDPTNSDSDDDGVDDRSEVNVGSKPGNADGIAPTITAIDCWVDPIVGTGSNGIKFLYGIKIKVTVNASDSSGVHYIDLEINNKIVRKYLMENHVYTNVTDEIVNITADFPFARQDQLIIKVVDFSGNNKKMALTPEENWPNFKGQNWIDPKVEFTLETISHDYYKKPALFTDLPDRFSTEYRGVFKRGIKNEYSKIKQAYDVIDNDYISKDKIFTKAYIDALDPFPMKRIRYTGIFLYTLFRIFDPDQPSIDYSRIRSDVELLSKSDSQYPLDFHKDLENLVIDFQLFEDDFEKQNTIVFNKIKNFFTSTLPTYLENNWGWWLMNDRDKDNVPTILKIGHGTYKLYSVYPSGHNDMDKDGIKDYDEFRVTFRPSLDAFKTYTSGWIDINIDDPNHPLIRCKYVDQRNFYLKRNYEFAHRKLIRKGITKDYTGFQYDYLFFRTIKNSGTVDEETVYTIYIILGPQTITTMGRGNFQVSFYRFSMDDVNSLDRDCINLPNAIYYHTETRLVPNANPIIQDIFVEIDWMWFGSGYYWWNEKILWVDENDGSFTDDKHKMTTKAKTKVISAFKKHGINLHIDDGTEGYNLGGGGPIPHDSKTKFYRGGGTTDNFWDKYKINTFETTIRKDNFRTRQGFYHYCIFAHNAESSDKTTHMGIAEMPYTDEFGIEGADDLIIGDGNKKKDTADIINIYGLSDYYDLFRKLGYLPPVGDTDTMQAAIFMHELGHNLNLEYTGGYQLPTTDEGYNPKGHKSCMNYYYILSKVDYTDGEWKSLNLQNINVARFHEIEVW
jgi:hypothetical protein